MISKEVSKRKLNLFDTVFDSQELYKEIRKFGEGLKYSFVEKEQESKPAKYGHSRKFVFAIGKGFDTFVRGEILVESLFENVNLVKVDDKELEKGDVDITVTTTIHFDYKNEWVMSKFHRKLFEFYLKHVVKDKNKKLYFGPLSADGEKIYNFIREKLEYYH